MHTRAFSASDVTACHDCRLRQAIHKSKENSETAYCEELHANIQCTAHHLKYLLHAPQSASQNPRCSVGKCRVFSFRGFKITFLMPCCHGLIFATQNCTVFGVVTTVCFDWCVWKFGSTHSTLFTSNSYAADRLRTEIHYIHLSFPQTILRTVSCQSSRSALPEVAAMQQK